MRVSVIGSGYVGLVTGTCLAHLGHTCICVDNNEEKVKLLKAGGVPIYEPGLDELIKKNVKAKRLSFSTDVTAAIQNSDIIFIAVNTPPKPDGKADLSYVAQAARQIATNLNGYKVIVDKSTVPVETGEKVAETIKRYNTGGCEFDVVSNPEFLREGSAVHDSLHPDRIVIGVMNERAAKVMKELYAPLNAPVIVTSIKSAELIKHASNSFLAMKISYMNALSVLCDISGADVTEVAYGMGLDKRIGPLFLNAGVGYGGSCFPKDLAAFIKISEDLGYDFKLLKEVTSINEYQKAYFVKKVEKTLWTVSDKKLCVWGLAFKPNTDDMRSAPSIDIIKALVEDGAHIRAYDPQAAHNARALLPEQVSYCSNPYEAAQGCDAVLILTEWDEFRNIDLDKVKDMLSHPIIIDGRNIFDPAEMKKRGFVYASIGRHAG